MSKKTYFNWSSGKDASLALYHMKQDKNYSVDKLLTSINAHHNRVSMHGLRRELLEAQVKSIGIEFITIELPESPSMDEYTTIMQNSVKTLKNEGFTNSGFGDIFLEDLRKFREEQLAPYDITCDFPLWKRDTKEVLKEFIKLGFKAVVICINANLLDESFAGRVIDEQFIADLPEGVDPCGENGEFHTFCFDGPIFKKPINFTLGKNVYREYSKSEDDESDYETTGFWFRDLVPFV